MIRRIGILVGRERSFPDALIAEVARRGEDVVAEYAKADITILGAATPYDVIVDRISHELTFYQPWLKLQALAGARVVNNPFWRIADDKAFNTQLAARLGIAVPKTAVLPSRSYGPDTSSETLHSLAFPLSWQKLVDELGLPLWLKPHWGGGWRDVYKVETLEELWRAYDKTGPLVMIAQESIEWTQYVRCIVIGREEVLPAAWDPRQSHFDRYSKAAETMPPLSAELRERVVSDARKLCRALGYDMNTVEFAVRDGVPYAIDIMNSAPDFDVSSLGESHFAWTVSKMATLLIQLAQGPANALAGPAPSASIAVL